MDAFTLKNATNIATIFEKIVHDPMKRIRTTGIKMSIFVLFLIFGTYYSNAATVTVTTTTTWSALTGGSGPGGLPSSADAVVVVSGGALTVNVNNAVCSSLTLGTNGSAGSLTFNSLSQLTISGNITSAGNKTNVLNMSSGGLLICNGITWTNSGLTWTPGNGTLQLASTNTLPTSVFTTFNNLTISAGTTTLGVGIAVSGTLTQNGGNIATGAFGLTVNGTHVANNNTVSGTGGTYTLGGGASFTTTSTNGVNDNIAVTGTKTFNTNNNFTFNGSTSQSTGSLMPATIGSLTNANTIGLTATGNITATSLDNGGAGNVAAILNMGSNTLTVSGTKDNTGATIKFSGASNGVAIETGTIEYYGSTQTVTAGTYNNLTITNTGTKTISATTTVGGALTLNASAPLDVAPGICLTVTGDITNAGALTLKCLANGSSTPGTLINSGTISGTGTCKMEQYLTGTGAGTPAGRGWYISSPVFDADIATTFSQSGRKVWEYNETANSFPEPSGTMSPKKGYIFRDGYSEIKTFTGSKFNYGPQNITDIPLKGTHAKKGYNLIGNPYPSYLDFHASTLSNMYPSLWYYTTLSGAMMTYGTYNQTGEGSYVGCGSQYIPPMQAVWVKASADGGSITVAESMRSHQTGITLREAKVTKGTALRLNVDNGTYKDETLISFNANALDGIDAYDSEKMTNNIAVVPEIATLVGGTTLAINGMNDLGTTKILPLSFLTGTAGSFSINATEINNFESDVRIILTDKYLNKQQDLIETPSYNFTSGVANTSDRFTLTFVKTPTSLENLQSANGFTVISNENGNLQVQLFEMESQGALISVYNVSGQRLFSQKAEGITTTMNKTLLHGFYLVEVQKDGFKGTKKIVINQ